MILEIEQIKKITKGALFIEESDGFYSFSRFTPAQVDVYKRNLDFYMKTKATAGIRFDFCTNSDSFSFEYMVKRGSSRSFCYFDIYIDNVLCHHIGKDEINDNIDIVHIKLKKDTIKRITVYFPCLSAVYLKNVSLEDEASIVSVDNKERFLFYGDSITQGYDAYFPSLVYAMRVSNAFNADCINQGIGAEVFDHETLDLDIPFDPTKVFIAYGTNDWSHGRESIYRDAEAYLKKIVCIHKDKDIYLITPIYRLDNMMLEKSIGNFYTMSRRLKEIAERYCINVIEGTDISVPSNKAFSDNWLHPNEIGFEMMANGIIKHLKRNDNL